MAALTLTGSWRSAAARAPVYSYGWVVKVVYGQGYVSLAGLPSSEYNPMINLIARRMGAERFWWYRMNRMAL